MKRNPSEVNSGRILILSDGKPGHVNQAIAFAKLLGCDFDLARVGFKSRWAKGLSYLLDHCGYRTRGLFTVERIGTDYSAVVSAGSETYYANRVVAGELKTKSVAIMLPKGYRHDFDLIVAQQHDDPPRRDNIIRVPVNLSFVEPRGLVRPSSRRKIVSLIIGGNSRIARLEAGSLRDQLVKIFSLFPDHDFWLTTSRRTPPDIEALLREFDFSYAVYYSEQQINPIPDFLQHSEYVFLTADSTSMISEAVSYGSACLEILPLAHPLTGADKFSRFVQQLLEIGCLHLFDGQLGQARVKIDLSSLRQEVVL
jgi:mitochondrial fission protein ELM1